MSSQPTAPSPLNIDLLKDLQDSSHLKALLQNNQNALLTVASEVAQFASQPIQSAVGAQPAKISISTSPSWKTSTGITFSLTPQAACTITIAATSTKFPVAKSIDSTETNDIVAGPVAGKVYINIDLDFSIAGSVSGAGSAGSIGISGKASGSAAATLSYCHAVDGSVNTVEAIKDAFSHLAFPFEPNCALQMATGDMGRVNFDGSLSFGLDVTYGIGSYKFSAPGLDSVQKSLQNGIDKLTFPTVQVDAGAKASVSYKHSDHFGAIILKSSDQSAKMYLVRSAANETSGSVGVNVGVSVTKLSATLDQTALAAAVNTVTGSGGNLVAGLADKIQSSLVDKTNTWLTAQKGDAGLQVQLSHQTNRALLYAFNADLTNPGLLQQSWRQFAAGDLIAAMQIGGLTMLPGSGVSTSLKNSVSLALHFFNLFSVTDTSIYFQKAYTKIGPDGSIRFLYDVGKEQDQQTKDALATSRIHFVASLTEVNPTTVQNAEVDLAIELSETNKASEGARIAATVGSLAADAKTAMTQFVNASPKGTLNLNVTLKPSAYRRLSCSPFTGATHQTPPPSPAVEDRKNWNTFLAAAQALTNLSYLANLKYGDWEVFNQYCNNGAASGTPNRRQIGAPSAVPPSFYADRNVSSAALLVEFFLKGTAHFMNLCDDLNSLAQALPDIITSEACNDLLDSLTKLAKEDVSADWAKPYASALLQLCASGGSAVQASVQPGGTSAAPTLTCAVTLT